MSDSTIPTSVLGRQGLVVSALGLGCMGMSQSYGPADEREYRSRTIGGQPSDRRSRVRASTVLDGSAPNWATGLSSSMRSSSEPVALVPFFGSRVTSPSRASCCRTARTVLRLADSASVNSRSTSGMLLPVLTSVERSRS